MCHTVTPSSVRRNIIIIQNNNKNNNNNNMFPDNDEKTDVEWYEKKKPVSLRLRAARKQTGRTVPKRAIRKWIKKTEHAQYIIMT